MTDAQERINVEIHFVELPKFRKTYEGDIANMVRDPLQKWLLLLDAGMLRVAPNKPTPTA